VLARRHGRRPAGPAHPAGTAGRPAGPRGRVEQADRRAAVPVPPHRGLPPAQRLPQARRHRPPGAGPLRAM